MLADAEHAVMVAAAEHAGTDMCQPRQACKPEPEPSGAWKAHRLDRELDHMFAWLLSAYKRPADAMGDKLVLHQMSSSLKLTELIDDEDEDNGGGDNKAAFTVTRQVSPGQQQKKLH